MATSTVDARALPRVPSLVMRWADDAIRGTQKFAPELEHEFHIKFRRGQDGVSLFGVPATLLSSVKSWYHFRLKNVFCFIRVFDIGCCHLSRLFLTAHLVFRHLWLVRAVAFILKRCDLILLLE